MGRALLRRMEARERSEGGFLDRYALRVDGNLATTRAEMAGILACLQRVDRGTSVAIGKDSKCVLDILERFRGKDSPPFLDSMLNSDHLGPMLDILHERMVRSAQTIFYKVRAHRGLALNEVADRGIQGGAASEWSFI